MSSAQGSQPIVGTLYSLGAGEEQSLLDGLTISSAFFNTRDLLHPGAPNFVGFGPGSQSWYMGYSVSVESPSGPPPRPDFLRLDCNGSFANVIPFVFFPTEIISLPVYGEFPVTYSGWVRMEFPSGQLSILNGSGADLEISFQFWGKSF